MTPSVGAGLQPSCRVFSSRLRPFASLLLLQRNWSSGRVLGISDGDPMLTSAPSCLLHQGCHQGAAGREAQQACHYSLERSRAQAPHPLGGLHEGQVPRVQGALQHRHHSSGSMYI